MPKVPQYQQQVENTPLVGSRMSANATAASFGGADAAIAAGIGQGLQGIAGVMADKVKETKKLQNSAIARDRFKQYSDDLMALDQEAAGRSGKLAVGMSTEYSKKADELLKKHTADLDPEQRGLFEPTAMAERHTILSAISRREEQAAKDYNEASLKASVANRIDLAVNNRTDAKTIADAEEHLLQDFAMTQEYKGMDEGQRTAAIRAQRSNLHESVYKALLDDSPSAGKAYLEQAKGKIEEGKRMKLLREEAAPLAEKETVSLTASRLVSSGMTVEEQNLEIAKLEPAIATKVSAEIKTLRQNEKDINDAREMKMYEAEMDKLWKTPESYKVPYGYMSAENQEKLARVQDWLKKSKIKDQKGEMNAGNAVAYTKLMLMNPNDLAQLDLTQHIDELNPTQYAKLVQMQRDVRFPEGHPKKMELYRSQTVARQAQNTLDGFKEFDTSKNDQKALNRTNSFYAQFDAIVGKLKPEERTPEKVQETINYLLSPVHKSWFGGTQYRFEASNLPEADKTKKFLQTLPENLKGMTNIKFNAKDNVYFIENNDVRDVYSLDGKLLKRYIREAK